MAAARCSCSLSPVAAGGVVVDRNAGILYGVTSSGGSANAGTVYQVVLP